MISVQCRAETRSQEKRPCRSLRAAGSRIILLFPKLKPALLDALYVSVTQDHYEKALQHRVATPGMTAHSSGPRETETAVCGVVLCEMMRCTASHWERREWALQDLNL